MYKTILDLEYFALEIFSRNSKLVLDLNRYEQSLALATK